MMRAEIAIAVKDLRLLLRDRTRTLLTFAWPLAIAVFFGAFAPGPGSTKSAIRVAWTDTHPTAASRALAGTLAAHPLIELENFDRVTGHRRLLEGDVAARLEPTPARNRGTDVGGRLDLTLEHDPKRLAEAGALRGIIVELTACPEDCRTLDVVSRPATVSTERSSKTADSPPSSYDVTFPQGIIWAVLSCVATFGLSLASESQSGTLDRLRMAPIGSTSVLAGKALACLFTLVVSQVALISVGVLGFDLDPASWGGLVVAAVAIDIGFVGIMMVVAVIGRASPSASNLAWAILMVMAMLGGGMLPVFLMPDWFRTLAAASPVHWAIMALEGAIWRGFSAAQMAVPCGLLVATGVASFTYGSMIFMRRDR